TNGRRIEAPGRGPPLGYVHPAGTGAGGCNLIGDCRAGWRPGVGASGRRCTHRQGGAVRHERRSGLFRRDARPTLPTRARPQREPGTLPPAETPLVRAGAAPSELERRARERERLAVEVALALRRATADLSATAVDERRLAGIAEA